MSGQHHDIETLRTLLREAEGQRLQFTFVDGAVWLANVFCTSHIDENDTLIVLRCDTAPESPAWQVQLADIRTLATEAGRVLYHSDG